jgi:hypothetical protein
LHAHRRVETGHSNPPRRAEAGRDDPRRAEASENSSPREHPKGSTFTGERKLAEAFHREAAVRLHAHRRVETGHSNPPRSADAKEKIPRRAEASENSSPREHPKGSTFIGERKLAEAFHGRAVVRQHSHPENSPELTQSTTEAAGLRQQSYGTSRSNCSNPPRREPRGAGLTGSDGTTEAVHRKARASGAIHRECGRQAADSPESKRQLTQTTETQPIGNALNER